MAGAPETTHVPPVSLALCMSGDCLDRFGAIVRHLVVGLVDHVARIRLVSSDPRAEELALGPTQPVIHPFPRWPVTHRRMHAISQEFGSASPTVVHAISGSSYQMGFLLAEEFDADLVLQVTALEDCVEVERYAEAQVGRILCFSDPLARILTQQTKLPGEIIEVIRPGVFAGQRPACFTRSDRAPSVVCTAPFTKGAGVERIIEAAHIIEKRGRKAMFFLLGQGPMESLLRRRARELNVRSAVTFAHPGGDAFGVISSADIFIHPAALGATYVDALQAMGVGLAVVTVPDPAADFFHPGETALVCEGGSAAELADGIDDLLVDRSLAQRLAAGAMDYVRKEHSMSAMADRVAAVYRRLLLARSTFAMRE